MDGRRQTKRFTDPKRAQAFAQVKAGQLAKGETEAARMSSADAASLARARELLSGRPVEVAAGEYADAVRQLGAVPLREAVQFYVRRHAGASSISVGDAVRDCLAAKGASGLSPVWLRDLRYRLARFAGAFRCGLASVAGPEVAAWLAGLADARGRPLSARSRNNYRTALLVLVRWAVGARHLPRDWPELDALEPARAPAGAIHVLAPDQMRSLLLAAQAAQGWAQRSLVPWLAIRGFAGVRAAEAGRLRWEDVHLESGYIALGPEITKTAVRRMVPIQDGLRTWLDGGRGPLVSVGNVSNVFREVCRAAGVPPAHNALRDSFISYRLAQLGDKARVAEEAGNSPRKIDTSYREIRLPDGRLITPQLAAEWFDIRRESVGKILHICCKTVATKSGKCGIPNA